PRLAMARGAMKGNQAFRAAAAFAPSSQNGASVCSAAPWEGVQINTVGQPIAILLGGPTASRMVLPTKQAGRLLIDKVAHPSITPPGPCGGIGNGVVHM